MSDSLTRAQPSFYLIRDHDHREIVVVFRGTQSLHDLVVDLTADEETITLPDGQGGQRGFQCHGGILRAARRLIDPSTSPLLTKVDLALRENEGYTLVLTGHSLGAACASVVAALIATRDPGEHPRWRLNASCGLPADRPLRAMCFGQPPIVDGELAALCASGGGEDALVTSVTLGTDVVPRIGVVQIREVRRTLGLLARLRRGVLERRRKADASQAGTHSSASILRSWWRWRRAPIGSDQRAMHEAMAWDVRRELDFHVRRRALLDVADVRLPPGRAIHLERDPKPIEGPDGPEERWIAHAVTDSTSFFALPWLASDCIAAHMPRAYLDACDTLP